MTLAHHHQGVRSPGHSLADKVVNDTERAHGTGPQSDGLPGELALRVLVVGTEAQTSTDQGVQHSISDIDGVVRVGTETIALGLASLDLLVGRLLGALLLLLGSLPLEALRLSGGLHLLVKEVGIDRSNVRGVDVDQRGRALRFILVDAAQFGSATALGISM